MFHGSLVALVTPMKDNEQIDYDCLHRLVDWHISNGTDGLVILGTTGEAVTINDHERHLIMQQVIKQAAAKIPVIVGTGSNSTSIAIKQTEMAMAEGADACLVVTPYYNKPTQEGLYQHFKTIADSVPIPLILYNVPSRTGVDMLPETVARLASVTNIIGIKEAVARIERFKEILNLCGNDIDVFSGDDAVAMEAIFEGARGVISVTANVAPKAMHEMCHEALHGDHQKARQINEKLMALHKDLFVESNPIPVKWALTEMKMIPSGIRLPLTKLDVRHEDAVRKAMKQAEIN